MTASCTACLGKEFCYGEGDVPKDKSCELFRPDEEFLDRELIGWADGLAQRLYKGMVKEVIMSDSNFDIGLSFSLDELGVEGEDLKQAPEEEVKKVTPQEVVKEMVVSEATDTHLPEESAQQEVAPETSQEVQEEQKDSLRENGEKAGSKELKASTTLDLSTLLHELVSLSDLVCGNLQKLGLSRSEAEAFSVSFLHECIDLFFGEQDA